MIKETAALLVVGFLFIFSVGCPAESSAGETQYLTLQDAFQLAMEQNPQLKLSQEKYKYSFFDRKKAWTMLLPSASLYGTYNIYSPIIQEMAISPELQEYFRLMGIPTERVTLYPEDENTLLLRVQESFFEPSFISSYKQSGYYIEDAYLRYQQSQNELLYQIAQLYLQSLAAKRDWEIAEDNYEWTVRNAKDLKVMFGMGQVSGLSLQESEVELAQKKTELVEARNNYENSVAQLCYTVGLENREVSIIPPAWTEPPDTPVELLLADAWNQRLDLKSLQLAEKVSKEKINSVIYGDLPEAGIRFDLTFQDPLHQGTEDYAWVTAWYVSIPLLSGGLHYLNYQEGQSLLRQSRLQTEGLRWQIKQQLFQAAQQIKAGREQIALLETQRESARRNLSLVNEKFRQGLVSYKDTLEARNRQNFADKKLVQEKFKLQNASLKLWQTIGVSPLNILVSDNK